MRVRIIRSQFAGSLAQERLFVGEKWFWAWGKGCDMFWNTHASHEIWGLLELLGEDCKHIASYFTTYWLAYLSQPGDMKPASPQNKIIAGRCGCSPCLDFLDEACQIRCPGPRATSHLRDPSLATRDFNQMKWLSAFHFAEPGGQQDEVYRWSP